LYKADGGSDQISFWEKNYPALQIVRERHNPFHHTSNELTTYLNKDFIGYCTKFVTGNLAELAQIRVPIDINFVGLNSNYMEPESDSLLLSVHIDNPQSYNYSSKAYTSAMNGTLVDSIRLYDDGNHGDGQAEDGVLGNYIQPLESEDIFFVDAKINNLDQNESYYFQDVVNFTSIGPVEYVESFDHRLISRATTRFAFKIRLQNIGQEATATDIGARLKLLTGDSCFTMSEDLYLYGDIAPGETADGRQEYVVRVDTSCLQGESLLISFSMEIESDGTVFWMDTFSVDIIATDITDKEFALPKEFALSQNYPNPFNPTTMINYQLPMNNDVELSIYNLLGQKIVTLVSEKQRAGYHQEEWDASGFASGIYYYKIEAGEYQDVKKMILLR